MNYASPEMGRITLTLPAALIKALRMQALEEDKSTNQMAEELLFLGGLKSRTNHPQRVDNRARHPVPPINATAASEQPEASSSAPRMARAASEGESSNAPDYDCLYPVVPDLDDPEDDEPIPW